MKKIRFFSDFCSSQYCKEKTELICQSHLIPQYGKQFTITFSNDYTHVIILNKAMPILPLSLPKENVIGFAFEPPPFLQMTNEFIEYAKTNIEKYYIGSNEFLPEPFVKGYAFMWHIVPPNLGLINPSNRKICSIMVSQKKFAPGHRYRHELVKAILKTNLPIDIYGRGSSLYSGYITDKRVKGTFEEMEQRLYSDYLFHIAIENFSYSHYISEKIINPMISGCTPIYWGASSCETIFPEIYRLQGNLQYDMNMITQIVTNPMMYWKGNSFSQNDVIQKTNLLKNIDTVFPPN